MKIERTKAMAGVAMLLLAVGTARADTITAIADGNVINSATWPVGTTLPVAGNTDRWESSNKTLSVSAGTYNGGTLVVQLGSTLRIATANTTVTMQNIVLDGGRIYNNAVGSSTYNFTTLELNSGKIQTGVNNANRAVYLNSGALAGSGTITIANGGAAEPTALVSFNTAGGAVTTTNFTGVFSVASLGELGFSGGTIAATFGIEVASGGFLFLTAGTDTKVTSLNLGGVAKTAGTYSVADLGAYAFTGSAGTITVIPEPATLGLITAVGAGIFWIRRTFTI